MTSPPTVAGASRSSLPAVALAKEGQCKERLAPFLIFILLALTACKEQPITQESAVPESPKIIPTNWSITRGGPTLQGRVHTSAPKNPKIDWTYDFDAPAMAEAAVSGNLLVVGDIMGAVHCIDLNSRKSVWIYETEDTIQAAPAISNNRVFVGSGDYTFLALDLKTGDKIWTVQGDEKFPSAPVVIPAPDGSGEWILINGYDGIVRCLNSTDGSPVWTYKVEDYINGTPAIVDDSFVSFGGCDKVIHVLNLKDGSLFNEIPTDSEIISSVATAGNTIFCSTYANQLVATNTDSEALTWIYETDGFPFSSSPAVDENHVYIGSKDKHLHAVDVTSGKPAWKFRTGGPVESSPLAFDDAIVFGSNDGRLYAVSREGEELWTLDLGEKLTAPPIYAQNWIIITGANGTVFVIK